MWGSHSPWKGGCIYSMHKIIIAREDSLREEKPTLSSFYFNYQETQYQKNETKRNIIHSIKKRTWNSYPDQPRENLCYHLPKLPAHEVGEYWNHNRKFQLWNKYFAKSIIVNIKSTMEQIFCNVINCRYKISSSFLFIYFTFR